MSPQLSIESIRGYAMPAAAPAYAPPPYTYGGNRLANVYFKTDPEVLAKLVPEPLQPIPDQAVGVYASSLTVVEPLRVTYREVGVTIPVMCGTTPGVFVPYMYLDTAMGIVAGREIWGFPKKEAEIDLREEDGRCFATVPAWR